MVSTAISRIDGVSTSVAVKAPVHAVATTNVTLSGLQTVGGVVLDGNLLYRVLLTGQTDNTQNGIYDASTGSWTRSDDFDGSGDVVKGTLVAAPSGSLQVYYRVIGTNPITPGTSAITFDNVFQLQPGSTILSTGVQYPQTPAEAATSVTPVNLYIPHHLACGFVNPVRYGAIIDGSTDDFTPMTKSLAVATQAGCPVSWAGNMAIASSNGSGPGYMFSLGNNVQVFGFGVNATTLTLTGTSTTKMFYLLDKQSLQIRDITLISNSQAASAGDDSAIISYNYDTSAAQTGGNIYLERIVFKNCKSSYWIAIINESATYEVDGIWIRDCQFISQTGNSVNPANRGNPAHCISLQGAHNTTAGLIRNVHIYDNYAECTFMKGFLVCWCNTSDVYAHHNRIYNSGLTGGADDSSSYAFNAYNSSTGLGARPTNIYFDDNLMVAPRDCGIYAADVNVLTTRRNTVTGQTSTADGTLPKGAIAINAAVILDVSDNIIDSCYNGIGLFGATTTTKQRAHHNRIDNVPANGYGIKAITNFSGNTAQLEITNNTIHTTLTTSLVGMRIDMRATAACDDIIIKGNTTIGQFPIAIQLIAGDSSVPNLLNVDISDNDIGGCGSTAGIYAAALTNSNQRISINRNKFRGTWGSAAFMLHVQASTNINVCNNEFCDMTSGTGAAIMNATAQGNIEGNRFFNVSSGFRYQSGTGLGAALPTWATSINSFVQDLNTTELGGAGNKYTRQGWQYDATNAAWKEVRCLTGN